MVAEAIDPVEKDNVARPKATQPRPREALACRTGDLQAMANSDSLHSAVDRSRRRYVDQAVTNASEPYRL
jgi:hypothetical protein